MKVVPEIRRNEIIALFNKNCTVREIANRTRIDKQIILEFLTKENHWSNNCSGCSIKRCYDCPGLSELGKPISIQDRINFIAKTKNEK